MKRSKLIAVLLVISISLLPLVPPQARAQGGYTEKINVYVAGSSAAWFVNLGGVNVTNPRIQSVEALTGVSSYNLTAVRATSWNSDFQVFGSGGYNVLPVPYVPPEGVFLTMGADSYATANSAAAKFGAYLLTTFQSTRNGTGAYSFSAPLAFSKVVPYTLFKLLPLSDGGFLTPITRANFLGLPSPMVTLSAQKTSGGGFVHQLSVGSITSSGLDSTTKPNILNYFGQAESSIKASNSSASSVIEFHFLNGIVISSDSAVVTTDRASFSSTYTLTVQPGKKVSGMNASVLLQPPELLATRLVDVGVLRPGTNMSVTVNLTNLSNSTALTNVQLNDSWWQSVPGFKLVRGNSLIVVGSLGAGQSTSPTYVLQYTGNATERLPLPATRLSYDYVAGTRTQLAYTTLNPMSISLGIDEPVVFAYVAPSSSFPTLVGGNQSLKVFIKNVGSRAASSVSVGGKQVSGLAADGGSASVSLSATAPSLTNVNVTKSYTVSYAAPSGQVANLTTNVLRMVFSQTGMHVGLARLSLNTTLTQLAGGAGYHLTLTVGLTNQGTADLTSFTASAALPAGLPCGKTSANLACSGGLLTLSYSSVAPGANEQATADFNVTQARSFIFAPMKYSAQSAGYALAGHSNSQPAPAGLTLSKVYDPSVFFPGMVSHVTAQALNGGPFTVFNASLSTAADAFDSLPSGQSTAKSADTLTQGSNLTLAYQASISTSKGKQTSAPATVGFYMGGTPFTITTMAMTVTLNQPPSLSVTTSPRSPVEGSHFFMTLTVGNPSSVGLSGVKLLFPIPSGVQVSNYSYGCDCTTLQNGMLTINVGLLAPGANYSVKATVSAGSGQTIPFKGASLSFGYANQTLSGSIPSGGIGISENVTTRYLIPIGIGVLALFAVAYELRRMAAPTAPASPK